MRKVKILDNIQAIKLEQALKKTEAFVEKFLKETKEANQRENNV